MLALHAQGDSASRGVRKPPVRQNCFLRYGDKFYIFVIVFFVRSQKHNLISQLFEKLCQTRHLPPERPEMDVLQ
jgi:hypothetical protein